jgi:hypothetical protein
LFWVNTCKYVVGFMQTLAKPRHCFAAAAAAVVAAAAAAAAAVPIVDVLL